MKMEGRERSRNRCVYTHRTAPIRGLTLQCCWSINREAGCGGPIALSKKFALHSFDLIGSRSVISLGLGYGESHSRAGMGMGKGA